ncbi:hypothetical protein JCM30237_19080 [Halolamina litorea]|uniref:DUF7847 domain-containing protein n=1 Tax=Halolamina litorea TaxID=1515593 RepID=A0ABD6BVS2_9EURY|nr:hypothetical protein [Halolamina litorea]
MSLNIGDALSSGAEKLTTTAGIQLGIAYVVLQLLTAVGSNSVVGAIETPGAGEMTAPALSLPIGTAAGSALAMLGVVLNLVLTIVAFRTLAHSPSELGSIPDGVTSGLLKPAVFLVIASIVQGVAIFIGFIALIIPGIFLMISLIFTQLFIAVEDEGPFEALSSSWSLAKGNRFPLFGLGVIIVVMSLLISIPSGILSIFSPVAGSVVTYVITGFFSIFSWGVLVASYQQLSNETAAVDAGTDDEDDGVQRLDDDSGFDYA